LAIKMDWLWPRKLNIVYNYLQKYANLYISIYASINDDTGNERRKKAPR
jgi:hypothetical protein